LSRRRARTPAPPRAPVVELPAARWTLAAIVVAAASGVVPLLAYVLTLSPTVNGGDSGEFIAVAWLRGVAHPSGYPLHTLLGALATLLPFGSVAGRVNLLSAVCDAGAAALLSRAVVLLTADLAAGLLAAGAFAFAPLIWPYAIVTEVFALNNLFAAGLVYWSARALREAAAGQPGPLRTLGLAAFWMGLGLANHHTLVFYAVPFGLLLLALAGRRLRRPRTAATLVAAAAAGFLPYLYLPLAAARPAVVTWGDPSTLSGFLTHFFRREYGTFRLADESVGSAGSLAARLALFGRAVGRSTFFAAVPLVVAALAAARDGGPRRRFVLFWSAALAVYVVVFCALANVRLDDPLHVFMQERFWQQGFVVVAALGGVGLAELGRLAGAAVWRWAGWPLALALPAALIVVHLPEIRTDANTLVRDYGEAVLRSVPAHGVLLVSGDDLIGSVRYLQQAEGLRPDVDVLPTGVVPLPWFRRVAARHMPELVLPPGTFTFRQLLDANLAHRPVVICNRIPWLASLEEAYTLWPRGLVEEVLPKGREPELDEWARANETSFARFDPARTEAYPPGSWERGLGTIYWKEYERFGTSLVRLAARRHDEVAVQETTVRVLERLAARPAAAPVVWRNLGVAYQFLARRRPEARASMVRAWRQYLATNPTSDPALGDIRRLVDDAERALTAAGGGGSARAR
jgi:dolichyl-phosphate-mannose-protein mannosyltransferase